VLSGDLITSILLAEFSKTHTIRISDFYRRRVARLTPVFVVWLATTVAYLVVTGQALGTFWGAGHDNRRHQATLVAAICSHPLLASSMH
jgi:peptidoglycan/LPS O-acetylase OafA/YrhL